MQEKRRAVVTGLGVVSPIGSTVARYWDRLVAGRSGIAPITRFDTTDFSVKFGGEVEGFDPLDYMDKKEIRRSDLYTQYALGAATQAMHDSRLDAGRLDPNRFGCIIGSGIGGLSTSQMNQERLVSRGPGSVSPFTIPMFIANMASGQVAIRFGACGINYAPVSACASGAHGIGEALRTIQRGECDALITGGAEACVVRFAVASFSKMGALSKNNDDPEGASRPFDLGRNGFVLSEGAAIIILEERERALARGAHIYAEIAGYGATCDAYHITMPHPEGRAAIHAIRLALNDGGLAPEDVGYVNAHGTSTPLNDKTESLAIREVFGDHARKLAVSSNKSVTGHLLGAAGALEIVATSLTLERGVIPPTINYTTPDPECDLDYVPNQARERRVDAAVSNSLGFGGHNVALAVRRHTEN